PGGAMSQQAVTARVEREPARPPTLTPYIDVSDARRAMDWSAEVFGAQRRGDLHVNADGTIGHAEVSLGDAVLMFAEASGLWPDVPVRAPDSPATFSHTLHLDVEDVDGTTERARHAGASVEREPTDQPYGRGSVIVDPFGHRWMLLRPPARATRLRQGDAANVTMTARDTQRAKEFYEAVLGVPFSSGHPGTWRTDQVSPPMSILPSGDAEPQVQLSYRVDDIAAAVSRVRAAGGRAGELQRRPFGLSTECADDQGMVFRLWQPGD
ncbi:MAG: VOC family protein, partial [Trebonia sp.]